MNQLQRNMVVFLVILASVLPWMNAQALETFEKAGRIVGVSSAQITISEKVYRIRSSTEMVSVDPSRQKPSDLKLGDRVFIRGIVLNGAYYIDRLVYEIPDPS